MEAQLPEDHAGYTMLEPFHVGLISANGTIDMNANSHAE